MYPNLIEHIRKYVELNESEVNELLAHIKPLKLKKKDYLLKEGDVCKSLYFVEKGCLRMFFINDKGAEQITQFAIENWWLADYMSLGSHAPSQFYIQAIENAEVFSLDHLVQDQLFKEIPQLERYFRLIFQKAYAASQVRLKYLYDFSKDQHYHHFIASFPKFAQRIPQYMLASYLGFTPEYLSEIRKNTR